MSTIALFDESPVPVGFLLFAGDDPVKPTAARDCVFMVLPLSSASRSTVFLSERKHQEFSVVVSSSAAGLHIRGECRPGEVLQILIAEDGQGHWTVAAPPLPKMSGRCEWAKGGK